MKIIEEILKKEFKANTASQAYKEACKWYAANVLKVNNAEHIVCDFKKVKTNQDVVSKVVLTLYVQVDETEVLHRHCNICNETGNLFYIAEQKHKCESCKLLPYRRRLQEKLKMVKKSLEGTIL